MSDRITLFREKPLDNILGFYIQYNTSSKIFWFDEIPKDSDLGRYNTLIGKRKISTRRYDQMDYVFRWSIGVKEDRRGVRYIPIEEFDLFIMQPFLHQELDHLRDTILFNAKFNFNYSPVKFVDV